MEEKRITSLKVVTAILFALLALHGLLQNAMNCLPTILEGYMFESFDAFSGTSIGMLILMLCAIAVSLGYVPMIVANFLHKPRLLAVIGCLLLLITAPMGWFGSMMQLITAFDNFGDWWLFLQLFADANTTALHVAAMTAMVIVLLLPKKWMRFLFVIPALLIGARVLNSIGASMIQPLQYWLEWDWYTAANIFRDFYHAVFSPGLYVGIGQMLAFSMLCFVVSGTPAERKKAAPAPVREDTPAAV